MVKRNMPAPVHKKKNVAKHVLKAQEKKLALAAERKASGEDVGEGVQEVLQVSKKRAKKSANKHVKAPSDASNYLVLWDLKAKGTEGHGWKFNKNTQSWLLRHMYNDEKVGKVAFKLLLAYMGGLPSKAKDGKVAEAATLVKDYKEWEKSNVEGEEEKEGGEDLRYDGSNWEAIGGKQKRKVYKRARQVYQLGEDKEGK
ncbi:hypothetical protein TrCOL_g5600 [Triparma columacea]|uniref:WKF domain-containing protein n=2 Tax=Triparma columacea TaxID=722753 RepID=A0A9W7LAY4_9STRA|nr:hypothetical protein TrCOL_g5600 [Triparma columacea]